MVDFLVKKIFIIICLCILISCSNDFIDNKSFYEIAEENPLNIAEEVIVEKIKALTKKINSSNISCNILTKRGIYYFRLKNYEKAMQDFENAIKLDSLCNKAYFGIGLVYLNKGIKEEYRILTINKRLQKDSSVWLKNYEQSKIYFNKFINNDSTIASGFAHRAQVNELLHLYDSALSDFSKAIKVKEQPNYYIARGLLNFEIGLIRDGNIDFKKAINLSKNKAESHLIKASFNSEKKNFKEAIEDYNWLIKNDKKNNYLYYFERAKIYETLELNNSALNDLKEITKIDRSNSFHYFEIAAIFTKMGNNDSAFVYIKKARNLAGNEKRDFLDDVRFKKIINRKEFNVIFE